jgi:glycosyltransferase involved in cell wall biosynthesis
VAIVSDAIYPYHHGGKEIRYHELARRLTAHAEVDVYTMRWWGEGAPEAVDGVGVHALCDRHELYSGGRRSIRQALFFAAACARLLFRRFDVIEADHIPYLQLFVLKAIAVVRRKRLVATWHEVWGPAYWTAYLGGRGRLAWMVERTSFRMPDAIVAASSETAERLRPYVRPGTPVHVAPNGIDRALVDAVPPLADGADVVFVGRLVAHKGVHLLLGALTLLRDEGFVLTARVIGSGPELGALRAEAVRLGLGGQVEFCPAMPAQADVFASIKGARVFVFPSQREGFGIAVLEALACGTPVVTTNAPDNLARHLVDRSGHGVVCDPSSRAVADAIKTVLGAPPETSDLSWLDEYDWSTVTTTVMEAYLA